ncbi:MAG: hypothetical protein COW73_07095 [Nitrospirae bacterium CG18_big_fil_WC_8_21_14_2_50_70_55]|nr:hypothetical protein [Deltaproteobacteria bacterium]OIP64046.1 MAG: hypothetical protein AUK30_07330 [Nitrospirae bacterium CG2_30_70_394]PIQ04825.1 MAG: hypothetical protein COW73_07095 [Nitrospirae bacterium CG18_big_fil_WC_8_21_14_2_50_70_55]PIU77533.1 MAG: hypothetical protein COS73_10170 [Nitrospirae bacterium CG06_land_8_20_14_3_00_70_43]PIW84066.1 MAG: hypothetical protein COZ96_00015 [Nitrospirae bacterium CG_4_8_14_3_um_filter_70_85]PIX83687.1 MAG: hypothetical protein COZ33_04100 
MSSTHRLILAIGWLLALATPGGAQLLDRSLAIDNQLLGLHNFPGPAAGEAAQDGVVDGLYLSGGLVWGLGEWSELHLGGDLGLVYDDATGATTPRTLVHRAYLQVAAGEALDWRLRVGILPERIAHGLLLDSDEPTIDLRLRRAAGVAQEASLLVQGVLIDGESPLLRAMASLDTPGRGHLSLWVGDYHDRGDRLLGQATAVRGLLLRRRLKHDDRLQRLLASPRGRALLDESLAEPVASDGRLRLAGLDGAWSWGRVEGSAVAVYEWGDYRFRGARKEVDLDVEVRGWLASGELRLPVGERLVVAPFVLYQSGDEQVVDRRLTTFVALAPFNPYATLFFNGSLQRDFLANTFQPVELENFGVVAGGGRAQVAVAEAVSVAATATYLRADQPPAALAAQALGWEVDSRLTWQVGERWALAWEWDLFVPGELIEQVAEEANTMQMVAATVRYEF